MAITLTQLARRPLRLLCASVLVLGCHAALAQTFPSRVIRIVTSGAGGGSDFVARLIAQGIQGPLGQPVIVDNQRNSTIAAQVVAKAPADGYTLMSWGSAMWIGPLLGEMPYDAERDFTPVVLVGRAPSILVVPPSFPANSVKELIALAKAKPGALNYSVGSIGSPNHLGAELFKAMAQVNITQVNYKGTGPAVQAVMSNEVQMSVANTSAAIAQIKGGKLKALGVTSALPSALVPDLPTVSTGLPGYEIQSADSIFAPAKLPQPILTRLNQEIVRYLKTPDAKEKLFNVGTEVVGSTPQELAALMKAETAVMGKVIKDAGIKAEQP